MPSKKRSKPAPKKRAPITAVSRPAPKRPVSKMLAPRRNVMPSPDATGSVTDVPPDVNEIGSGFHVTNLQQRVITKRVHLAEINRRIFGADTDLDVIAGAISSANRGYMVDITDLESEAMSYDPHLSSLAVKRFGALASADLEITPPPGVSPSDREWATKINDACSLIARKLDMQQAIYDTAWALFFGRAGSEVQWAPGAFGFKFAPYAIDWIHPRRLCFGAFRELRVVDTNHQTMTFTSQHGVPVEELPGKFLYWKPRLFSEYAEREGLGPRSMFWAFFKRFNQRCRMKLIELFAIPWRIIEVDKDGTANPESIEQAKNDVEDLGGETTAVLDAGIKLNVEWPGENSGEITKMNHDDVNAELSKLWAGNTATTDQSTGTGGNRANSIIGKGEQDIIFQLDGGGLSKRLQNIFDVFVVQSFGPGAAHLTSQVRVRTQAQRDRDKELDRVTKTLGIGLPIAEADVRETAGFRAPLPDEVYMVGKSEGVDASGKPLPPQIMVVDPAQTPPDQAPHAAPNSTAPAKPDQPGAAPKPGAPATTQGNTPEKAKPVPPIAGPSTKDEPHEPEQAVQPDAEPKTKPEDEGVDGAAAKAIKDILGMVRQIADHVGCELHGMHGQSFELIIREEHGKWNVYSEDGKSHLGGPYDTKAEAETRLREIEEHKKHATRFVALDMPRNMQPATAVHGSPETIVERGTTEGARETTKWAAAMSRAAAGDSALEIRGRLKRANDALDVEKLSRALERRIVFGLMLGALDADWESVNDRVVKPPAFDIGLERDEDEALALGDLGPSGGVVDFVGKPFADAVKAFNGKEVVTRRAFDRLAADAKKHAFTVAGLAKKSMLETAHEELTRALQDGDDLRKFAARLGERFDSAGWTKLNPSHVEVVFRNATMGAYAQGRDAQMTQPHVLEARPYWQILGVKDNVTRATHRAALGKVLRADDGFWGRAPLPWGHNCRCRKVSRSEDDVKRLGLEVISGASLSNLPDKGWNSK